ncbi:MAG: flavodoxin family protein [Deltaproteobacteria bacterium]|nr:flavodoxin family protein [Deltaproteobacteria bacterium]
MSTMKKLLIVFHSMTGGTLQMAEAAVRGAAAESEVAVDLRHARDTDSSHVLSSDAYIFATPENLAMMSGMMKDFFDRTYYDVLDRIVGRPYATLICAGSDGENAARQIARICVGWKLKAVAEPTIVITHSQTPDTILSPKTVGPDDLERCEEIGATLAVGLALGIY